MWGGATAQTQNFPNIICRVTPWHAAHGPLQVLPAYGNPTFVRDFGAFQLFQLLEIVGSNLLD